MNILVINGPNLNLLGTREKHLYGTVSLDEIKKQLTDCGNQLNLNITFFQSNHEGEIIDCIHHAKVNNTKFIIINPGALAHTSIALRDALLGVNIPFVEVHLSNIYQREDFRHVSYLSDIASGLIVGCGSTGYYLALLFIIDELNVSPIY